jgi:hypothetical protein
MEIEQQWRNLEPEDDILNELIDRVKVSRLKSHGVLSQLKKSLQLSIILSVIITVFALIITLYFSIWQVQLLLLTVDVFCIWTIVISVKLNKKIVLQIDPDVTVLQQLKIIRSAIHDYINIQQKVSLFVYPSSIAAGFLIGGVTGSAKTVDAFLANKAILLFLVGCIAVFTPISYYFAGYLFKLFYGKQMDQLNTVIKELEDQ